MSGPLEGTRVVELAGLGAAPYACMLLAEAGADVLRIARPSSAPPPVGTPDGDILARSRPSVGVDLKRAAGTELVLDLVATADVLVEGYRPGVAERLGLGPEECWARNARLVYGRMTGFGQDGPLAARAGHDIDYLALAGALWPIGRAGERPVPPLNLVGDFGGGGALLAFGVVAALVEAARSGRGQVVDAAMVDGAASLTTMVHGLRAAGAWSDERGVNLLDTGAPFYEVYEARDGRYVAVGAIERPFYEALLDGLGLEPELAAHQMDRARWPETKARFAEVFASRTRDEWVERFEGTDACVAPVLSLGEAPDHPHNRARGTFVARGPTRQPGAVPRFSRTPSGLREDADAAETLGRWGIAEARLRGLRADGVVSRAR